MRALALTTTVSYGVLYYAYAVFLPAMERDLNLTRAQTGGAFSLALFVSGLAAPLVGRVVDRRGARLVMALGSLLGTLLVLAWSRVTTLPALYATWLLMGVAMSCVFYDPAFAVVTRWFHRDRPKALMTITLVAGLASTIFVPLSTALLHALGWRSALVVLAAILCVTTILPHALLLRRDPADLGMHPDGASTPRPDAGRTSPMTLRYLVGDRAFRRLTLAFALAQFTAVAIAAHVVPLLLERGHTPAFVALAAGAIGLAALPGRAVFGLLVARFSSMQVMVGVFTMRVLALLALAALPGMMGVGLFAALFGASNGMTTLVRASLVAEWYGRSNYGAVSGALTLVVSLSQAAAPLVAGVIHTGSGSYAAVTWALWGCAMFAAGQSWRLRNVSR